MGETCDDGNGILKDGCESDCTSTPGGGCKPPGPNDLWFHFNWYSSVNVKQPKYSDQGQKGLFSWQPGNKDGPLPIVVGTPVANMGGAVFMGNTVWVSSPNELTVAFGLWNLLDFASASFCMEGASGAAMEEIQIDMLDGPCGANVVKVPWVWPFQNQEVHRQVTEVDITDCVNPDSWETITFRPGAKMLLQDLTVVIRNPVVVPKP
jgi:hypothetical protein